MLCPHCGLEQPIAETCNQCGKNLFQSEPIEVTEEQPASWGVRVFLLLSILIGLAGAYWILGSWRKSPPPEEETATPVASTTPTPQSGAAPTSVLALTQIGTLSPQILRDFEAHLQGSLREVSLREPQLTQILSQAKPDVLVLLGDEVEKHFRALLQATPSLTEIPRLVLTRRIGERKPAEPRAIYLGLRPPPPLVGQACRVILDPPEKFVAILYDPKVDEEYALSLYGQFLSEKFQTELLEFKTLRALQASLDKIPAKKGFLLLVESPALMQPLVTAFLERFLEKSHWPLAGVGTTTQRAGALLEIQVDESRLGQQMAQLVKELKTNPAIPTDKKSPFAESTKLLLHKEKAARLKLPRAPVNAQIFQKRNPGVPLELVP
jgi:hypothetical protein